MRNLGEFPKSLEYFSLDLAEKKNLPLAVPRAQHVSITRSCETRSEKGRKMADQQFHVDPFESLRLFLKGFLFDNKCSYNYLPKDVVSLICSSQLFFNYSQPFDGQGVLSWLRNRKHEDVDTGRIIIFTEVAPDKGRVESNSTYYFEASFETGSYDIQNQISSSRSIEILGQETRGVFCSSRAEDERFFILDLQKFKLCPTYITMSSNYEGDSYLASNQDVGPLFLGTNDELQQSWSTIKHDIKPVHSNHGMKEFPKHFPVDSDRQTDIYVYGTWKLNTHEYYRYFKIQLHVQEGKSKGSTLTLLSGLEMYGYLA